MKKIYFYLVTLFGGLLCSCQNSNSSDIQPKVDTVVIEKESNCVCTDADARSLAYKIESDFRESQNQLDAGIAKVISIYGPVEKRDNCTWVATFKISFPFGNTDGASPDQFIKKRFACDGKQIYVIQ